MERGQRKGLCGNNEEDWELEWGHQVWESERVPKEEFQLQEL
jgi:hypothetical protein